MPLILDLQDEYERAKRDPAFGAELDHLLLHYVGRPSPLYFAERLTKRFGGAKVYLKRDELNHTGAHKINNVLGQILLARRMGKTRIIAETGAGQHGVATATACAKFGLQCVVYMGAHDVARQEPNVFRMRLLGATVIPVTSGRGTLKDAMNDAMRDWVTNVADTFYCIGTVAGPHPYPAMVRDFQCVIGREARAQMLEAEGRLPDTLVAAIGGGSNAMGLFHPFLDDPEVAIVGVEAGGKGVDDRMEHCASLTGGRPGVLHGNRTYLLQDDDGQILEGFSISAGLDYPGIGPEHAWLHETGRARYVAITDAEALAAFQICCAEEGIIPALEPAHALAQVAKMAPELPADHIICMNMCGPRRQGHLHRRKGARDGDHARRLRARPWGAFSPPDPPTRACMPWTRVVFWALDGCGSVPAPGLTRGLDEWGAGLRPPREAPAQGRGGERLVCRGGRQSANLPATTHGRWIAIRPTKGPKRWGPGSQTLVGGPGADSPRGDLCPGRHIAVAPESRAWPSRATGTTRPHPRCDGPLGWGSKPRRCGAALPRPRAGAATGADRGRAPPA